MAKRPTYSARAAMAKALEAHLAADQHRQDVERRATATRDAAVRQATDARDRAIKTSQAQASAERDRVARLLREVDQYCQEADRVLDTATVSPPVSIPSLSLNAPGQTPEQALAASHHAFAETYNRLLTALTELARVRNTLLVRAMRKIGLPPL